MNLNPNLNLKTFFDNLQVVLTVKHRFRSSYVWTLFKVAFLGAKAHLTISKQMLISEDES